MSKNKKKINRDNLRRSGFEPQIEKLLKHEAKAFGYTIEYEPESFEVDVPIRYVPDFRLSSKNGKEIYIECKGYFDDQDRKKVLNFTKQYPEILYHIVFQRNNPLRKGSNFRYLDWCEKNGISASVGTLPEDLMKEVFLK